MKSIKHSDFCVHRVLLEHRHSHVSCAVYGYFYATVTELSTCTCEHKNIYYLAIY